MEPETSPPSGPHDEPGFSLLVPSDQWEEFRRRAELPSRWGRYVLAGLGALSVGAGTGMWFARPSSTADGILVLGLVLVGLGFVQHRWLLRDRKHWPTQVLLWSEGLELVLTNGEIRAAPWSDPKFVLDLYARPLKRNGQDEYVLVWKMDSKIPACPITPEGFDRVREMAVSQGLEFTEYHADNRRHTLRGFEIRVSPPATPPGTLPNDPAQALP
jgi:hypothetical protein